MDTIEDLVLVGLSQRTAPTALRDQYTVSPEDAAGLLRQLVAGEDLDEAVVVSTCNRTEVTAHSRDGERAIARLHEAVFRNAPEGAIYAHRGVRAVMHLFRVAAGLDSLVLGESEILGQVKRGFECAEAADAVGRTLRPLFTQALVVGKRARNETPIGEGSLSVARVGVDVAARVLGRFEGRAAAVVGAGETGLLATRHLLARGVRSVSLINRTLERAEDAAGECGERVTAHGLDELGPCVQAADLAFFCVDNAPDLVRPSTFDRRALAKRDQPLVLIDLSVPRAVSVDVRSLDGVLSYDLDALLPIVEEHRTGREAALEEVGSILVGEVHKFLSLRTYASFSPAIDELRSRFTSEREAIIDRVTGGQATPRELELAHAMEKQLLGLALGQMKESARHARSEDALDRLYRRFVDELGSDARP